jgi:hypothetical protein
MILNHNHSSLLLTFCLLMLFPYHISVQFLYSVMCPHEHISCIFALIRAASPHRCNSLYLVTNVERTTNIHILTHVHTYIQTYTHTHTYKTNKFRSTFIKTTAFSRPLLKFRCSPSELLNKMPCQLNPVEGIKRYFEENKILWSLWYSSRSLC